MVKNRIVYINIFSRSIPYYYKDLFLEQGKSLFNLVQTVYFPKFNLSVLSTTDKDIVTAYNKKTFPKKHAIINNKNNLIYSATNVDCYRLKEKVVLSDDLFIESNPIKVSDPIHNRWFEDSVRHFKEFIGKKLTIEFILNKKILLGFKYNEEGMLLKGLLIDFNTLKKFDYVFAFKEVW